MRCAVWGKINKVVKEHCSQSCHHSDFSKAHLPARMTPDAFCLYSPFLMKKKGRSCCQSCFASNSLKWMGNCLCLNFCSGVVVRAGVFFNLLRHQHFASPSACPFLAVSGSALLTAGSRAFVFTCNNLSAHYVLLCTMTVPCSTVSSSQK